MTLDPTGPEWTQDYDRLRQWLSRFTYKPGWRFTIQDMALGTSAYLDITFETTDTYSPDKIVKIGFREPMRPAVVYTEESFAHFLLKVIERVEIHEAREWLRYDNVVIFNPHRAGSSSRF